MVGVPRIGLNRWDFRSVDRFAASVADAEAHGVDVAFVPVNPLGVADPYVLLAAAAARTSTIGLGPLLETPVLRPAPLAAGSIATLQRASGGRAMLVYGAAEAGRTAGDVALGLIVHTCRSQDVREVRAITRAMAAGFYEYAPALFDPPGFVWSGPPIEELKPRVRPDFHHAHDLVAAGEVVGFLPDDVAASFSFSGTKADVADQLRAVLAAVPEIDLVVPHPVPNPPADELAAYVRWIGEDLKARL